MGVKYSLLHNPQIFCGTYRCTSPPGTTISDLQVAGDLFDTGLS